MKNMLIDFASNLMSGAMVIGILFVLAVM